MRLAASSAGQALIARFVYTIKGLIRPLAQVVLLPIASAIGKLWAIATGTSKTRPKAVAEVVLVEKAEAETALVGVASGTAEYEEIPSVESELAD